ncbi:RNA polymerase II-associated protein 3-like [Phymastichus coffea]|uniref:RNA polymerase II-associated protein 3-like n=1 Tax=Phymastichus coffea TaxID=108790 RepID=UPI00273BA465|nr:RNA polymerase II-associated protein 3-like [Phymastichus coffea]XP_058799681.1 RNA polymerase II-associated protein 3-like [Phymastichus coffea]XP_058799682.1 RNA polymerase II-associated protein 3-like [Phymastichus coffea]XP_058799683.1 RNA polymerase II-associated protein 3-like [Phymastichus coffea]
MAHKSILLQKQIRDNSEDLQKEFLDMEAWEEQMKKKDFEIRHMKDEKVLPPVRTKKNKKKVTPYSREEKPKAKRIASSDYKSWDKFDVEKACDELDEKTVSKSKKEKVEFEIPSSEQLEKEHTEANKYKDEGNLLVKKQEWAAAIGKYNQALKIFPHDAVFYANRALCQLKLNNLYSAEADCTAALNLNSNYIKAYHRRASARIELKHYEDAKKDIETVIKLEPSNKEAKCMLVQVQERIDAQASKRIDISGSESSNFEKRIGEKLFEKKSILENTKYNDNTENKNKKTAITEEFITETNSGVFKQTIEHKDDQKIEKIKLQETESTEGLPPWLPKLKENVSIIEPLTEASQKSKQKLKRILIKELPSNESIFKDVVDELAVGNLESSSKGNNINKPNVNSKLVTQLPISNLNERKNSNVMYNLPPPPKSAVAFLLDWRKCCSTEYRYKYLKQINPKNLPGIFKDSMESNIFSEILQILNLHFTADDNIYDFLNCLAKLKRFKTLVLFMSASDKEALKSLFNRCKNKEGRTEEDLRNLHATYEM